LGEELEVGVDEELLGVEEVEADGVLHWWVLGFGFCCGEERYDHSDADGF
jgi:hypothetical protein